MSKHRVPQWMNMLWLVLVVGLVLSLVGVAIHRGYDFVEVLGFLVTNVGLIFFFAIILASGLYGLSILLEGTSFHRSHCKTDEDHTRDMANLVP